MAADELTLKYAAFEISPASFDEITRVLRARQYHHVFDSEGGAIYFDLIALTRGETQPGAQFCSSWLLENNKAGADHRYLSINESTGVLEPTSDPDKALRFSRDKDASMFSKMVALFMPVCSPTSWEPVPHLWG